MAPCCTEAIFWAIGRATYKDHEVEVVGFGPNKRKRLGAINCALGVAVCFIDSPATARNDGHFGDLLRHVEGSPTWYSVPDRFIQWHKASQAKGKL